MAVYTTETDLATAVAQAVDRQGGVCWYVGGYVRDILLGIDSKDIDMEVHGIQPDALKNIIAQFGEVITIGAAFGIYSIKGYSLDIALPRKETARGTGHRDFDVFVDPFIGTEKAAMRRDFTINSLMQNVLTGEICDHFGGADDLENGIIRHVDSASFAEDPLRVLRGAQFAARFGFEIAAETKELCSRMDLSSLAGERVEAELRKALMQSDRPSVFFENLRKMKQLDYWFKELANVIGVPQNPVFHAEGDVWTHTMMVVDQAAKHRHKAKNPFGQENEKGEKFIRFLPVEAWETPTAIESICIAYNQAIETDGADALLVIPMLILDFLSVHPFKDGNGRMSRLLTLLLLYRAGYNVGKYISIEKQIERTKESYYDALHESSVNWHENKNDYKPFIRYMLGVILAAYREFNERVNIWSKKPLAKTERVAEIIKNKLGAITKSEIVAQCPDIAEITVQRTLAELTEKGDIIKIGGGRYTKYVWNEDRK